MKRLLVVLLLAGGCAPQSTKSEPMYMCQILELSTGSRIYRCVLKEEICLYHATNRVRQGLSCYPKKEAKGGWPSER